MSFWTWLNNTQPNTAGEVANENGPLNYNPGDPNQLDVSDFDNIPEPRSLPWISPSPWSGWPSEWSTPNWTSAGIRRLIDVAWACLDLNSSVLSSMPVYRLRDGRVIEPTSWMTNPDPATYTSWNEFCKQLMWDFMLGEAFVLPMANGADGYPMRFRVIPPWLVTVEMNGGTREYRLGGAGGADITGEVLHIRYRSTTDYARGYGPLESAGARMTAIGLLQRYANNLAETGGTPLYWLGVERRINPSEGRDLLDTWIESRTKYAGHPALVGSGATLNQASSMNAQDMALLELQQFNESRISVLLGVQPYLIGLPGPGGLTYSNVSDLTDFHDRSSLRPKANAVMTAISQWALPRGQSAELNRDDYTRAELKDRVAAYKTLVEIGALSADEIRVIERFYGVSAPAQLTGGLT